MGPIDYLRILRRRWPVIASAFVVAVAAGIVAIVLARPDPNLWQAEIVLFRNGAGIPSVGEIVDGAGSEQAASAIAREVGLTPEQVDAATDFDAGDLPATIQIRTAAEGRGAAEELATVTAAEVTETVNEVFGRPGRLEVLFPATSERAIQSEAEKDRTRRRLVMAVLVGAFGGLLLAFAVDYFDRRIWGAAEAKAALSYPVLADLPTARNPRR